MRVILRSIGGLLLVLIIAGAGVYFFRAPLVAGALKSALAGMGVVNPSLTVKDVSLSRLQLADISGGGGSEPSLRIASAEATYDVMELIRARRVRAISAGPGSVGIDVNDRGELRVAGALIPLGKREPAPLPFDSLALKELAFSIAAPQGGANGLVSGEFSREAGGAFDLAAQSEQIVVGAWSARAASVEGALMLAQDGGFETRATVEGDLGTPYGEALKSVVAFDADGGSWRDVLDQKLDQLGGGARGDIRIGEIPVATSPILSSLSNPGDEAGDSIKSFSVSSALAAEFGAGRLSIAALDGAPVRIVADRGDIFAVSAADGALYEQTGASRKVAVVASASGKALTGEARLNAQSDAANAWTFSAGADLAEQSIAGFSLGASAFSAEGAANGADLASDLTVTTLVKDGAIGSIRMKNAPFKAALRLEANLLAKTLTAVTINDECIALERASFSIDGQDSDARLTGARLCGPENLIVSSWGENPHTEIVGDLTARQGRYRLGQTMFEGAPPAIKFTARHDGSAKTTTLQGALGDGRVVLNNSIVLSDAEGGFDLRVGAEGMSGEAQVARVRLSQQAEAAQIAPVIAAGNARLADSRIEFDYTGATPQGRAIGAGTGAHNIETGRGETEFRSGDLRFSPQGLQPAALAPGLLGIIGTTTGGASADLSFAWGPLASHASSSAKLEFRELTFRGPGIAVSETRGVTGALELSSLAPLKSDGLQTLTIGMIDFNSLKLEKGILDFTLPGDETLHVIDTEFPWFGGKLGIYDATAALTGETANIPLKALEVDLAQILAFVDIEGLSGEGILSGSLPLIVKDGKANIVDGELKSDGPGAIRYVGKATEAAAASDQSSAIAFSILRDLRFTSLRVLISGPLDGRIDFKCEFEGTGEVPYGETKSRLPVRYNISIDAPLLDLLNQASLTSDVGRQIQLGVEGQQ